MFAKENTRKGKKYLSIVESYRDDAGKPRHRTVASLGNKDALIKSGKLKTLLKSICRLCDTDSKLYDLNTAQEKDRIYWGAYLIVKKLWDKMQLDKILYEATEDKKIQYNFFEAVFLMLVDRFSFPCSKYQTYLNQDKFSQPDKIELHQFYRSLDVLSEKKEQIELALFKRCKKLYGMEINVVLYDVTTLYFESVRPDELKNFGWSKDHKFGEVQVVVALITDLRGRPIGFEVLPGNMYEGDSLKVALEKLKKTFKIEKLIFIADQGMLSAENLDHIRSFGYEYIIGARIKSKPPKIKEDILDLSGYEDIPTKNENDTLKVKNLKYIDRDNIQTIEGILRRELDTSDLKSIRRICEQMMNTLLGRDIKSLLTEYFTDPVILKKFIRQNKKTADLKKRVEKVKDPVLKTNLFAVIDRSEKLIDLCDQALLDKKSQLKEILRNALKERLIITWSSKRKEKNRKDRERLYKKAVEAVENGKPIINKQGYRKYINIKNDKPTLNPYKIVEEEQWDGFFGIQTNNQNLETSDISSYYHQLWQIEYSFRLLKTHLETRPIYHWSPNRIRGHLVNCFLALLLERNLELELWENRLDFSTERIRKAIHSLQASRIEVDGEGFFLRSQVSELAGNILKLLKIKIPPNISHESSFEYAI